MYEPSSRIQLPHQAACEAQRLCKYFHMDKHQAVQVGYQLKHGVTFMTPTTPHLLNNMARADNCCFQKQGQFDCVFNWCNKDFALIAFGMNSTGAHYNLVSISIVNSESKIALDKLLPTYPAVALVKLQRLLVHVSLNHTDALASPTPDSHTTISL
jgi:hypothetical protein